MIESEGRERSNLSPHNRPIRRPNGERARISLREITLRQLVHCEGELTPLEKQYWLKCLDDAGVQRTALREADPDAADIIRRARDSGLAIKIELMGQVYTEASWRRAIRTATEAGGPCVYFTARTADWALEGMGATRQQMLDYIVQTITASKDAGLEVSIALAYAAQADLDYLAEVAKTCEAAGVDMLHVSDSEGGASPVAMYSLVHSIKQVVGTPMEVHCHNDCGLAVANTIASVEAGAEAADVCVNGADPHRGGLTNLAELVVALELLYDVDTGIKLSSLTGLSRIHETLLGWPTPPNMPIVGPQFFSRRLSLGKHVHPLLERDGVRDGFFDPFYAEPGHDQVFAPETVGNREVLLLGKYSGPNEVAERFGALGIEVEDDQLEAVAAMVRDRGASFKRTVTDEELVHFLEVVRTFSGS